MASGQAVRPHVSGAWVNIGRGNDFLLADKHANLFVRMGIITSHKTDNA
jgi:hypothetical protein